MPRYNRDVPYEDDVSRVRQAAIVLMEYYDSVQIVCTRAAIEGTRRVDYGKGNYYARLASVREWLEEDDAKTHENVRRQTGDDGDNELTTFS